MGNKLTSGKLEDLKANLVLVNGNKIDITLFRLGTLCFMSKDKIIRVLEFQIRQEEEWLKFKEELRK